MRNIWVEANEATSVNKRMDGESGKIAYMLLTDWDALESYLASLAQITVDEFISDDSAPHLVDFKDEIAYDAACQALKAVTNAQPEDPLWNVAMLAMLDVIQDWTK